MHVQLRTARIVPQCSYAIIARWMQGPLEMGRHFVVSSLSMLLDLVCLNQECVFQEIMKSEGSFTIEQPTMEKVLHKSLVR